MRDQWRTAIAGVALLATAGLTLATTPSRKLADSNPAPQLDEVIPERFGDWRVAPDLMSIGNDEERKRVSDAIYDQLLMRTYVNSHGEKIMLVVAYGSNQSDSLQVHKPEVCYTVQGYQVRNEKSGKLDLKGKSIPVKRLVAVNGLRVEPITYWITVGNRVVADETSRKLAQIRYGITGQVPDGMLIRVSSISYQEDEAYNLQAEFMQDLMNTIPAEEQSRFIGARPAV